MALTLPDPGNATTSARDSGCFTLLGEDERAAISSSIVPNLKPLLPRSMCSVRLTECVWECGDRSHLVLRDQDCFDLIERHRLSLTEGTFVQAKLKVDVIGKSTRPVLVDVRVPSRIEVSQKAHERVAPRIVRSEGLSV